jgi:hypothetical protein
MRSDHDAANNAAQVKSGDRFDLSLPDIYTLTCE